MVGRMVGGIKDLEVESDTESETEEVNDESVRGNKNVKSRGVFSLFR